MRKILTFASVCALTVGGHGQGLGGRPVISVCDLLGRPSAYNETVISVRGVYLVGGHGLYLKGEDCAEVLLGGRRKWPAVLWVELRREEVERRGFDYAKLTKAETEVAMAKIRAQVEHGFAKGVTKVTLTYTGLFETRTSFDKPQAGVSDEPGFGDQGYAPGQIFVQSVSDIVVELK